MRKNQENLVENLCNGFMYLQSDAFKTDSKLLWFVI